MRAIFIVLLTAGLPIAPCINPDTDTICTMEFVYGVNINLTDAQTTQPITGATCILICSCGAELPMEESLGRPGNYFGAGERPDTYSLTIRANGYQDVNRDNIVVTSDPCHVIPVSLDIQMNPI
ncbi:MAG: peptidase associated/transthyretin-like domain-containing protein [Planctomycetota bacterium]|jgi:hypothetical protein